MSPVRLVVVAVLLLLGLVWIGQGLGWIGGSFMSSQPFWAAVGAVVVVAAGVIAWRGRRVSSAS